MNSATIRSKGQITIPVDIRTSLGLAAGDKIHFIIDGESVMFVPATKNISMLKGIIAKPETPVTIDDMKATIKKKANQT